MSTSQRFSVNQKGFAPVILILLATAGVIIYLLISSSASFKNGLFSMLYPKPSSHAAQSAESVPDEILIKFKAGVNDKAKENIRNEHGLQKLDEVSQIGVEKVKVNPQDKDKILEALSHNPRIKYAEPNYLNKAQIIPNDIHYQDQWSMENISAPSAWDISTGSPSVVIAILDTGIDFANEDLIGRGTGALDDYGHGTEVAGIAGAAGNNSKGIAGLCWNCPLLSVKVLNSSGSGSDAGLATGITTAVIQGTRIINMSLGGYATSNTLQDAINYAWSKGVILVAAAGNDNTTSPFYPAAYPKVIAVGGSDYSNLKLSVSNYGSWIEVVAPGDAIDTTHMGGNYDFESGTSMASPHVAGLAGLIFSANPNLSNQQVVDIITSTTDDLGDPGFDQYYGWGRINAYKALQKATGITPPPADTTSPTVNISSPTSGSTVSGLVDINVNASDNVGVTKVEFYVDGILLGTDSGSPYVASWDTTSLANSSSHNLLAKAYDNTGNVGTSSTITVTVNNPIPTPTPSPTPSPSPTPQPTPTPTPSDTTPPVISIINPLNGSIARVNSKVNITATASDNVGIAKVEFYVNNSLKCTDTISPYSCTWSVPGKKNTNYTIQIKGYDEANNTSSVSITVKAQ